MLVALLMGFACGLPLLLTLSLLQAWMKEEGVDLTVIGLMALVGLPYTLKFLWAPFLDRFTLPFFGRRRGWLLIAQLFLIFSHPKEPSSLLTFVERSGQKRKQETGRSHQNERQTIPSSQEATVWKDSQQ